MHIIGERPTAYRAGNGLPIRHSGLELGADKAKTLHPVCTIKNADVIRIQNGAHMPLNNIGGIDQIWIIQPQRHHNHTTDRNGCSH